MLAPATETISGLPARMLVRLAQDYPDGLSTQDYDLDALSALLPDDDKQSLREAVFELKALDLLKSWDFIWGWRIALLEGEYAQIDPQMMGWDTEADSIEIARLMLEEEADHAPKLH